VGTSIFDTRMLTGRVRVS